MLPNESLLGVLEWCSRNDLDVAAIASRLLNSLIVIDLNPGPLRSVIVKLTLDKNIRIKLTKGKRT